MFQYRYEYLLSIFYPIIGCLSAITTICCAIAWRHWEPVLDRCPYSNWYRYHDNCGCILYGKSFEIEFRGGSISMCHFVTFGPIVIVVLMVIASACHIIRVCINEKGKPEENMTVESLNGEVIVTTNPATQEYGGGRKIWLTATISVLILSIYLMVLAGILTDGYHKTCEQYRKELVRDFNAIGNQQAAIYQRLSCSAIFDFMDYLFPDYDDHVRGRFINTAVTLNFAMISAWFSSLLLLGASYLNFKIAQLNKI